MTLAGARAIVTVQDLIPVQIRTTSVIKKQRFVPQLLLSFPLMAALATCHAAGEVAGYIAGARLEPHASLADLRDLVHLNGYVAHEDVP